MIINVMKDWMNKTSHFEVIDALVDLSGSTKNQW